MAELEMSLDGNVSGLVKALNQAEKSLIKTVEAIRAVGDALNTGIIKSSSKAAKAVESTASTTKKSAQIVVSSLQSELKAAEKNVRAFEILDKKLSSIERKKGESQKSYLGRIESAIFSTRNLPAKGATTGGASTILSPDSRDKVIQYQRAVESLMQKERDLESQRKKNAAEQRQREAEERKAASEKLRQAQIAAVSKTFNVPSLAANAGIAEGSEQYKQLQSDALVVSKSLGALRYALYDVSRTATVTGVALLAAVVVPAKAAIDLDRQFADVERTTGVLGNTAIELKNEFIDLAQTVPVAFSELAKIGTLAGQLGISTISLTNFTENVAKFAATTDVSVTDSATAFGRLGELIDGVNGQYDKLGSAILKVGTESVATESQIINTAQQIAAIGNAANLTADQVIGLSGALASLGTTPELSRGLVTRLFANINSAISLGGRNLKEYDRLVASTGMTFKDLWQSDSSKALVEFFRGISFEGDRAAKTLNDIGITSVRDVPAILRLGQNLGLLQKLLADSKDAFATGTEINKQYGVIADTVAAKIEKLGNNINIFFASIGDSASGSIFASLIDLVTNVIEAFTDLTRNPLSQWIFGIVGSAVALVGVLALLAGAITRATASGVAFSQVMITLRTALNLMKTEGTAAAVATLLQAKSAEQGAVSNGLLSNALIATARNALVVKAALRGLLIAGIFTGLLVAVGAGFQAWGDSMKSASEKAKAYFGDIGSLIEAARADTQVFEDTGDAIGVFNIALNDSAKDISKSRIQAEKLANSFMDTSKAISEVEKATQKLAFGGNTAEWFKDQFISNEQIQKIANDPKIMETLKKVGFDFSELIGQGMTGKSSSLYIQGFLEDLQTELGPLSPTYFEVSDALIQYANAVDNSIVATKEYASANDLATEAIKDLGSEATLTKQDIDDMVANVYDAPNRIRDMGEALYNLGGQFAEGGKKAIETSEEMQNAISAITYFSGTASQGVANLNAFLRFLRSRGYASAEAIKYLKDQIISLGGDAKGAIANIDFSAFIAGMNNAGDETSDTAAEVRTLVDYANDLQDVFSRAFDLRFKAQLNMDDITTTWRKLSEEIRNARQEVNTLKADRATLEYFLSVAEAYGDTLRANKLRAQIAEMDQKIADATSQASTELNGNSDAAIANRKRLSDLVSSYQDYIVSLAESGASQNEINNAIEQSRRRFIAQAQQLGFSRKELEDYSQVFVDMTQIIREVPRNITVRANTDPALQALNEFAAKARRAGTNSGNAFEEGLSNALQNMKFNVDTLEITGKPGAGAGGGGGIKVRFFKDGGYTGNGNPSDTAGIVHRGEYVIPANVVDSYGVGFFDQLSRMKNPSYVPMASASPTSMMVSLSPDDRALLRGAGGSGDIILTVDSREIARANARGSKLVTGEGGYLNG